MLYFQIDCRQLSIDGLIDTSVLSSAIPEANLQKIRLLAPHTKPKEDPPPEMKQ